MSYIQELRALVGHRPLLLAGVVVMVFDEDRRILLQHRTDDKMWDLPGQMLPQIRRLIESFIYQEAGK